MTQARIHDMFPLALAPIAVLKATFDRLFPTANAMPVLWLILDFFHDLDLISPTRAEARWEWAARLGESRRHTHTTSAGVVLQGEARETPVATRHSYDTPRRIDA
jgi:hypothetical protein